MTFENAAVKWTETINDWYKLNATPEETIAVFNSSFKDRKAYDGTSYVEMFFKNENSVWSPWLDTADREEIADLIEIKRGVKRVY